jgi:hypothetical protein
MENSLLAAHTSENARTAVSDASENRIRATRFITTAL